MQSTSPIWCATARDARAFCPVAGRRGIGVRGHGSCKRGCIRFPTKPNHSQEPTRMNFPNITLVAALALVTVPAFAQTAAPAAPAPAAPASPWTVTGNAGLFSDYTFRGISQTNQKPAFQGGIDVAHASGFYAGNWNSNVDSAMLNGASIEMDFYGGYKATVGDFGIDVGAIYYYYPGTGAGGSFEVNNGEIYIGGSWGPFTA